MAVVYKVSCSPQESLNCQVLLEAPEQWFWCFHFIQEEETAWHGGAYLKFQWEDRCVSEIQDESKISLGCRSSTLVQELRFAELHLSSHFLLHTHWEIGTHSSLHTF